MTISLTALGAFALYLWRYPPAEVDRARTLAFTVLVMAQLILLSSAVLSATPYLIPGSVATCICWVPCSFRPPLKFSFSTTIL